MYTWTQRRLKIHSRIVDNQFVITKGQSKIKYHFVPSPRLAWVCVARFLHVHTGKSWRLPALLLLLLRGNLEQQQTSVTEKISLHWSICALRAVVCR